MFKKYQWCLLIALCFSFQANANLFAADPIHDLQTNSVNDGKAAFAHWGWEADKYTLWGTHTNRLIPVYTFGSKNAVPGVNLSSYSDQNSPYRNQTAIRQFYGRVPKGTFNPKAEYFDQTNLYDMQLAALRSGKKHIFLVVFDGMDWQTTQAAAIWKTQKDGYQSGRGAGLHFQDYQANGTTQYGAMVAAPYASTLTLDINTQSVTSPAAIQFGGYASKLAGQFPWSTPSEGVYLVGESKLSSINHPYPDSAATATSMTTGYKTYNGSININPEGVQLSTIAHLAQKQGWKVGAVSSVPISHATPAAAYSHNVSRNDYQDLTRDLLGLPSISHPDSPLIGLDVLIGAGFGSEKNQDKGQGDNFVPGNAYLTQKDLQLADSRSGGKYTVALRTAGQSGAELLKLKADDAIASKQRLFGYFGTQYKHLPFQTADGKYNPPIGRSKTAEEYTEADVLENPTLKDFTEQAIRVLSHDDKPFWLLVEAGDVDWANHDNNIDNSIGAVLSGDDAVRSITNWVEKESNWEESLIIVTADHGHYLVLDQPELLLNKPEEK
ncbi:MAG: alkaline phosphatase [Planctomycetaceae bacterium]|nr:alkaline phosphatase [Planctomycetaceae bacterium]